MYDFLHTKGYTFFSIPRLTYAEVSVLTEEHNNMVKKEEAELRKQKKRKGKREWFQ